MKCACFRFFGFVTLAGLALALIPSFKARAVDSSITTLPNGVQFWDVKRDGTGTIWGADSDAGLWRYTAQGWKTVPLPGVAYGAVSLLIGTDGAAYGLWTRNTNRGPFQQVVVRAYGNRARVIADVAGYEPSSGSYTGPSMVVGAHGDVWSFTEDDRLTHVDGSGSIPYDKKLPRSLYRLDTRYPNFKGYKALDAFPDDSGNMWFYSQQSVGWGLSLRGFLAAHADKPPRSVRIAGLPDDEIDAANFVGNHTIWAYVHNHGMYAIDETTMSARPAAPAIPRSVNYITSVDRCGKSIYVLAYANYGAGRSGDLWRLRSGKWARCVAGIDGDSIGGAEGRLRRWFIRAPAGVWIQSLLNGAWYDPDGGGPVVQVDWRRGVRSVYYFGMAPLPGRKVLFDWGDLVVGSDSPPPLLRRASGNWMTARSVGAPAVTSSGEVILCESTGVNTMDIWNGAGMRHVAYPQAIAVVNQVCSLVDDHDRYWPLPDEADHAAGYYDLKTGAWRVFGSLKDAVLTTYRESGSFKFTALNPMQPAFNGKGDIVFRDNDKVYYYYAGAWRTYDPWSLGDIANDWWGAATFSDDGLPRIWVDDSAYKLTGGKWIKYDGPQVDLDMMGPQGDDVTVPAGCITSDPDSVVLDKSSGIYYLTYDHRLYRQYGSTCRPALPDDGVTPFVDGRKITGVFDDCAGNVWLACDDQVDYVMIPHPAPRTVTILVTHTTADGVAITFANAAGEPLKYMWRVNGAAWSDPQDSGPHDLTLLPAGKYTVDVRSIDDYANPDLTVTSTTFTIVIDTAAQIKGLVAQLTTGTDTERNDAMAALVRQPEAALPALNAALPNAATDEAKWWINAAIQACQQAEEVHTPVSLRPNDTN